MEDETEKSLLELDLFLALHSVFFCVAFGSGHPRESQSPYCWCFGWDVLFSGTITVETQMEINGDDPLSNPIYWNHLFWTVMHLTSQCFGEKKKQLIAWFQIGNHYTGQAGSPQGSCHFPESLCRCPGKASPPQGNSFYLETLSHISFAFRWTKPSPPLSLFWNFSKFKVNGDRYLLINGTLVKGALVPAGTPGVASPSTLLCLTSLGL